MAEPENSPSPEVTSEEFREKLSTLKAKWKAALKRNKKLLLKCPNFEKCQFKCGSVGGMNYHYLRCAGASPMFKCPLCSRLYESRTGLNYHTMSNHGGEPVQEESESHSRPIRTTASTTPLKLSPLKATPKTPPLSQKGVSTSRKTVRASPPSTTEPCQPPPPPLVKKIFPSKRKKGEGNGKGKEVNKSITIPSIEYPDEYKSYLPLWRQEMKDQNAIKCPNFKECGFKCTTVNGMKYHFVRCGKDNPPEFNCEVCGKKFQCRTGLVWHLKKHHKLVDIQPSKEGGFRGTIPDDPYLERLRAYEREAVEAGKRDAEEKRRRKRGGGEKVVLVNGTRRVNRKKRLRKCQSPRRTAEDILQNVWISDMPPTPKLGPETDKHVVPKVEFNVTNDILTDIISYGSAVISLGEDALEWQKMSSGSESDQESDYTPTRECKFFRSGSSASEDGDKESSDEDYTCSFSRKKKRHKPKGTANVRLGAKKGTKELKNKPEPPEGKVIQDTPVFTCSEPPPLLVKQEKPKPSLAKPNRQAPPALIKAPPSSRHPPSYSRTLLGKSKLKDKGKTPLPPQSSDLPVIPQQAVLRAPPPLVKKGSHKSHVVRPQDGVVTTASHLIQASPTYHDYYSPRPNVQLNQTKTHYKSSKGQASSYSTKGFKMTQYEFQPGTPQTTTHYHHTAAPIPVQNVPNLVSPIQYIPGVHTAPIQMASYQNLSQMPPGGVFLMQSPYITQEGQTYQLVTSTGEPISGEISQKVSVIMNPQAPAQGGYHYITQLDGPPTTNKTDKKYASSEELNGKFEAARKEEQAKLGEGYSESQNNQVPPHSSAEIASGTEVQMESQEESEMGTGANTLDGSLSALNLSTSSLGSDSLATINQGDSETVTLQKSQSAEDLMTEQLKTYLEKERARKAKCSSPPFQTEEGTTCQLQAHIPLLEHSQRKRSHSVSASRSSSMSPVYSKTLKAPRLIVSPMLFSLSKELLDPRRKSTSKSPAAVSSSHPLSVPDNETRGHHHGPIYCLSKKRKEMKRATSPDLSSLFYPDNCPSKSGRTPSPEASQKLLEFSSSLHHGHAHLLKRPIAVRQGEEGSRRKHSVRSPEEQTSSSPGSQQGSVTDMILPSLVGGESEISGHQIGDILNTNNCNNNSTKETTTTPSTNQHATRKSGRVTGASHTVDRSTDSDPYHGEPTHSSSKKQALGKHAKSAASDAPLPPTKKRRVGRPRKNEVKGGLNPTTAPTEDEKSDQQPTSSRGSDSVQVERMDTGQEIPEEVAAKPIPEKRGLIEKTETEAKRRSGTAEGKALRREGSSRDALGTAESCASNPVPAKQERGSPQKKKLTESPPRRLLEMTQSTNETAASELQQPDTVSSSELLAPPTKNRGRPAKNKPPKQLQQEKDEQSTNETDLPEASGLDTLSSSEPSSLAPPTKKRGRPAKNKPPKQLQQEKVKETSQSTNETDLPEVPSSSLAPPTKKRGRPPKNKPPKQLQQEKDEQSTNETDLPEVPSSSLAPPTKKRGRPPKNKPPKQLQQEKDEQSTNETDLAEVPSSPPTRGRGRPRKSPKHEDVPMFNCPKCDKKYSTKAGLKFHQQSTHPPEITPDTPLKECVTLWRQRLKKVKHVVCHKCETYKGGSVPAMKYHVSRCGKTVQDLSFPCPNCSKPYTTKEGLAYHIKTQHQQVERQEEPTLPPTQDIFSMPDISQPLPTRQAAQRATDKLQKLVVEESGDVSANGGPTLVDSGVQTVEFERKSTIKSETFCTVLPELTNKQFLEFQNRIRSEGSMECPVEDCQKTFRSLGGLRYHLIRHEPKTILICPMCKRGVTSQKRLENHMRSKHPDKPLLEDSSDRDFQPSLHDTLDDHDDNEMVEDWDAEMEAQKLEEKKSGGSKSSGSLTRKLSSAPHKYHLYQTLVKEITSHMWSNDQIFQEWQPQITDWEIVVDSSSLPSHLPNSHTSVHFSFEPHLEDEEGAKRRLELFESMETEHSNILFFAGGPVWAMDWLPMTDSSSEQFVALAAYRDLDQTFPVDSLFSHNGLLQLWTMGDHLANSTDTLPEPRLAMGVLHDYGCIRALKWCPSCCWQREDSCEEGLPRLGLLALACSDGCIRLLSIPHPTSLFSELPQPSAATDHKRSVFVRLKHISATLVPTATGFGVSDWSRFGQCLCMDWFPGNGHTKIAGGFSNGVVCVWDLTTPYLRSRNPSSPGLQIHPQVHLAAHTSSCRCVIWCPQDSNYLFTGGQDRIMSLWDLRQPHTPQERQEKGLIRDVVWPLLWCSVYTVEDGGRGNGVCYTSFLHDMPGGRHTRHITQNSAHLTSMSHCVWSDRIAVASFTGELSVTSTPTNLYTAQAFKSSSIQNLQRVLYNCKLIPLSPEAAPPQSNGDPPPSMRELADTHRVVFVQNPKGVQKQATYSCDIIPLASFNKVSWNPNHHSCEWLLCASNSGLMLLMRAPKPINKPRVRLR